MMLLRYYRLFNYLSLDVVAGAVICSCFAEKVLAINQPTGIYNTCLALSIWLVYTVDRLIDVSKKNNVNLSKRHQFHKKYSRLLWGLSAVVLLVDAWLAVNALSYHMLVFGLLIISAVAAYLIVLNMLDAHRSKWFQKEPLIAIIYTLGVWGSKIWLYPDVTFRLVMLVVVPFFLLALMNLLIFSYFETERDQQNKQRSITSALGTETIGRIIMVLFALILTINLTMLRMEATGLYLMISTLRTVMAFILFGLFYRSEFFYANERYRLIGDAVFMLPLVPLLFYF